MSQLQPGYQSATGGWTNYSTATEYQNTPLRKFRRGDLASPKKQQSSKNVGHAERIVSVAAGSILGLLGAGRRDLVGLVIAGVGAALVYRGASGQCSLYKTLGISTTEDESQNARQRQDDSKVRVSVSFLINKPAEKLYTFWRNFENLPQFMTHLESVRQIDDRRSHWVAKAPKLYGGKVEWDAEITTDEPNSKIAWRSLPDSDVDHYGSIKFSPALGDRGTKVFAEICYEPPAGKIGRWTAKLFGEEPAKQIHDDLRNFKRIMETGEILTIEGQPRGTCTGRGIQEGK